jgi:hypothetical protein
LTVPNFAKVIDFIFSDGLRFDTNQNRYFHLRVTNVQQMSPDGKVFTFRQEADGTMVPTGAVLTRDPQELEHMIEEALAEKAKGVNANLDVMITPEQQDGVQRQRAEASLMGQQLGVGSMLVNEAREAFDRFCDEATETLSKGSLGRALDHLGFEVEEDLLVDLIRRHSGEDASCVSLSEFIKVFAELDKQDMGISIV